jgi:hypothetical protein
MAVLIEGISVVVRWDAIDRAFRGGRSAFLTTLPNKTYCGDDDLARLGFMAPAHVQAYVGFLQGHGLVFIEERRAVDLAVVDQVRGPTCRVGWLEFARVVYGESGGEVGACWLRKGPRRAEGSRVSPAPMTIATPAGWRYEGSLSARHVFVPTGEAPGRLEFLEHRPGGVDVYRDAITGEVVSIARDDGVAPEGRGDDPGAGAGPRTGPASGCDEAVGRPDETDAEPDETGGNPDEADAGPGGARGDGDVR